MPHCITACHLSGCQSKDGRIARLGPDGNHVWEGTISYLALSGPGENGRYRYYQRLDQGHRTAGLDRSCSWTQRPPGMRHHSVRAILSYRGLWRDLCLFEVRDSACNAELARGCEESEGWVGPVSVFRGVNTLSFRECLHLGDAGPGHFTGGLL